MLDSLTDEDNDVRVWRLENNYEDVVRAGVGEKEYDNLTQKYPSVSKPIHLPAGSSRRGVRAYGIVDGACASICPFNP